MKEIEDIELTNYKKEWLEKGIKNDLIEFKNERIYYLEQEKSYEIDPEEKVRAVAYTRLVLKLKYPPKRIEFEVRVPERPKRYADIIIYKNDNKEHVYAVGEAKATSNKNQVDTARMDGLGEANTFNAPFLYLPCGDAEFVYDVSERPTPHDPDDFKKYKIPSLPKKYGKPPTYRYIRGKNNLRKANYKELRKIFGKAHDILWAGGKRDPSLAFNEMSKLIFTKIHDELTTKVNENYHFQVGKGESEKTIANRIINRYEQAKNRNPDIFTEGLDVKDRRLKSIVKELQDISLRNSDLDAKGRAFEEFLSVTFRGKLGQYFTRRELVEFMIEMTEPKEIDKIIDPACGSGGFLLYALKKVRKQIEINYKGDKDTINRNKYDFANENLYGIEINEKIARIAMMDMSLHDDAKTNIENNTGLDNEFNNSKLNHGTFSLLLANPPFGENVEDGDSDQLGNNSLENYVLAQKKSGNHRQKEKIGILFLEAYYNFLADNGRLGVVISDGILSNRSYKYRQARKFIRKNFRIQAIVSLPSFAFNYNESGLRTSLLFLKKEDTNSKENYEIFMAMPEKIGYDSTGRPDDNELPDILDCYKNKRDNKDNVFWVNYNNLEDRLDPIYYNLGPVIKNKLDKIPYEKVNLESVCEIPISSGNSPEGGLRRSTGEVPILCIGNMTEWGNIYLEGTDVRTKLNFVPSVFYENNKESGGLKKRDILIAKDGATTGMVSFIDEDFELLKDDGRCMINEHIFRARVDKEEYHPEYIFYFLFTELGQLQIKREISGGAQTGITKGFVKNIKIPKPPKNIQIKLAKNMMEKMKQARKNIDKGNNIYKKTKHEFSNKLTRS